MKKYLKYLTVFLMITIVVISLKTYVNPIEDISKDNKFKTWIELNGTQFYDNEDINIQLNMQYIGDREEIEVYIPKFPFSLLISGNNGFQSIIESHNMFGTQKHTFEKNITMDCSDYANYHYIQAMKIFKGYEQSESYIGAGGKSKL